MTKRERLIKAIKGEVVDRAPVIAPAGLVNSLPPEVLEAVSPVFEGSTPECFAPGFGRNPDILLNLSVALSKAPGFESLGLPYTVTVESEAYGGETECGPYTGMPRPYEYPYNGPEEYESLPELDPMKDGRLPQAVETLRRLRASSPDMPIVADIVGPVSLATSLMDTGVLLKSLLKSPDGARAFLEKLTDNSIRFMKAQLRAGADVVFITDPASTVDILGPKLFGEFSVPLINRLSGAAVAGGAVPIVHICGRTEGLASIIGQLNTTCISLDSLSGRKLLPEKFSLMGGVASSSLLGGAPAEIRALASAAALKGISILAPSCGLSGDVPMENLKALTGKGI